ncbi:MAG: hypothetical protein J6U95_06730 [Alistipes sp.]|jgi:hypothetical protein|nr:hypothetical protein [Alistipes sp.]
MKKVIQLLLLVVIGLLVYWIYAQIDTNVKAEDQIKEREGVVIEKAKVIRELVQAYKDSSKDKKFTTNWDTIIEFAKNGVIVEKSEIYDENNLDNRAKLDSIRKVNKLWKNEKIVETPVREKILKHAGYKTDEEIENLRYIPFSNNKEFQLDTVTYVMGTYKSHLLRCHAPYVHFINTEEYNQQFWNMLESKFEYFIANSEASDQMKKMKADGLKQAIQKVEDKENPSKKVAKYFIGSVVPIPMDIEFFGVTFGSLEENSDKGSWEDGRLE